MDTRVVAVVVTYNRKDLLCECLDAILAQSIPVYRIMIVNNASTDGTLEKLTERGYSDNPVIHVINLEKNEGGAGGFYAGMKSAREVEGYSGLWIMDDDTIPAVTCLENLLKADRLLEGQYSFLASSVYGFDGSCMNVPSLDTRNTTSGYPEWYRYLKNGLVAISEATFVSLLINRKAVERCGLPCRDFFIWGDDTEYTMRIVRNCDRGYMVGESEAIHKRKIGKVLSLEEEVDPNRIKMFSLHMRNSATIQLYYNGWRALYNYEKQYLRRFLLLMMKGKFSRAAVLLKSFVMLIKEYRQFKLFIDAELKQGESYA